MRRQYIELAKRVLKILILISLLVNLLVPFVVGFQNGASVAKSGSSKTLANPLFSTAIGRATFVNKTNALKIPASSRNRAAELSKVVFGEFLNPVVASLLVDGIPSNWDSFWSQKTSGELTNAHRLAKAIELCGPTYVKFAQAVSSRPDIVPNSLANALSKLQDDMEPFDSETAKNIVRLELSTKSKASANFQGDPSILDELLQSLSSEPVAAASVGQVYSGHYPGYGKIAVKVKRPGIRELVESDAQLLRSVATWIESIPSINLPGVGQFQSGNNRLIATELVSSVDEFMSRLFEELDYRNEAANMEKFASLYCIRRGSSKKVKVVVPEVLLDLCTDNVIVMEWIEGTKLTNVVNEDGHLVSTTTSASIVAENLELVELCIQCTLSQLLDTGKLASSLLLIFGRLLFQLPCLPNHYPLSICFKGYLHADPHG